MAAATGRPQPPTVPELYPSWFINHLDPSRAGLEPSKIHNQPRGVERNDPDGFGWNDAPRAGGKRLHQGVDIKLADPSAPIVSPIDGKIVRRGQAYPNANVQKDPRLAQYNSVHIQGTGPFKGMRAKLLYVDGQGPKIGDQVIGGVTPLGYYQGRHEISESGQMLPHVHLETFWNGRFVDPATLLPGWKSQRPK
ncbi:MAG: hypothetical protein SFV21_08485 [Rhodospirillaceae bacterium]|nr:hypothetical protein [Rhodospirillaceae bacterium]